jgi:hypothetical protein
MSLTKEDVKSLCAKFDEKTLGVKVQSFNREKTRAMLVCYVQHTDVAARLDSVDPAWGCKITDEKVTGDLVVVRMQISLKGIVREGVGEGGDSKSAASDALKRAAMLFGIGRYLYDVDRVWIPYDDSRDRFKVFTYADYSAALRPGQNPPAANNPPTSGTPPKSSPGAAASTPPAPQMSRMEVGTAITKMKMELKLSDGDMADWIHERYRKTMSKLSLDEMIDFHGVLEGELTAKKERRK